MRSTFAFFFALLLGTGTGGSGGSKGQSTSPDGEILD